MSILHDRCIGRPERLLRVGAVLPEVVQQSAVRIAPAMRVLDEDVEGLKLPGHVVAAHPNDGSARGAPELRPFTVDERPRA